ncbi:hypothetical protein BC829DRAFT_482686 [Chytridium lagenaria]|nr:hypothetical protein BC829DRAFT_482686 [Chytridium lagenaria]
MEGSNMIIVLGSFPEAIFDGRDKDNSYFWNNGIVTRYLKIVRINHVLDILVRGEGRTLSGVVMGFDGEGFQHKPAVTASHPDFNLPRIFQGTIYTTSKIARVMDRGNYSGTYRGGRWPVTGSEDFDPASIIHPVFGSEGLWPRRFEIPGESDEVTVPMRPRTRRRFDEGCTEISISYYLWEEVRGFGPRGLWPVQGESNEVTVPPRPRKIRRFDEGSTEILSLWDIITARGVKLLGVFWYLLLEGSKGIPGQFKIHGESHEKARGFGPDDTRTAASQRGHHATETTKQATSIRPGIYRNLKLMDIITARAVKLLGEARGFRLIEDSEGLRPGRYEDRGESNEVTVPPRPRKRRRFDETQLLLIAHWLLEKSEGLSPVLYGCLKEARGFGPDDKSTYWLLEKKSEGLSTDPRQVRRGHHTTETSNRTTRDVPQFQETIIYGKFVLRERSRYSVFSGTSLFEESEGCGPKRGAAALTIRSPWRMGRGDQTEKTAKEKTMLRNTSRGFQKLLFMECYYCGKRSSTDVLRARRIHQGLMSPRPQRDDDSTRNRTTFQATIVFLDYITVLPGCLEEMMGYGPDDKKSTATLTSYLKTEAPARISKIDGNFFLSFEILLLLLLGRLLKYREGRYEVHGKVTVPLRPRTRRRFDEGCTEISRSYYLWEEVRGFGPKIRGNCKSNEILTRLEQPHEDDGGSRDSLRLQLMVVITAGCYIYWHSRVRKARASARKVDEEIEVEERDLGMFKE